MITFWLVALLLLATTTALLGRGLYGRRKIDKDDAHLENIRIGQLRLAELDSSSPHYADEKLAIESALLDDLAVQNTSQSELRPIGKFIGFGLVLGLPLASIALFFLFGNQANLFNASPAPSPVSEISAEPLNSEDQHALDTLVDQLENILKEKPNDAEGWTLAARTYMSTNQFDKAQEAFANLNRIEPGRIDVLTAYADAIIMGNGNRYTEEARSLIEQALKLDPTDANALWMSAIGHFTAGNRDLALSQLEVLKDQVINDAASVERIDQVIANILSQQSTATTPKAVNGFTDGVTVNVSISENMHSVESGDTVFIVARGTDGIPAPIAVARLTVADLPVSLTLNDSHAMLPERSLSSVDEIRVIARVSKSGSPRTQPGDLVSHETKLHSSASVLTNLLIDQKVSE